MTLRTRLKLVWHQDATEVKTITDNVIPKKSWHWKVLHWSHINLTGHSWWWGILKSVSNLNPDWRGLLRVLGVVIFDISARLLQRLRRYATWQHFKCATHIQTANRELFSRNARQTNLILIVDFFEQRMQILVFSKINSFSSELLWAEAWVISSWHSLNRETTHWWESGRAWCSPRERSCQRERGCTASCLRTPGTWRSTFHRPSSAPRPGKKKILWTRWKLEHIIWSFEWWIELSRVCLLVRPGGNTRYRLPDKRTP